MANKALNGSVAINSDYLDKLQNTIGEWHDNIVAAQLFSASALNDKAIATKIKRKNTSIKKNIINLASDFMNKATQLETSNENQTLMVQ